jgi:hypothetical protein
MARLSRLSPLWSVLVLVTSHVVMAQVTTDQALDSVAKGLENAGSTDVMDTVWRAADKYRRTFGGQVNTLLRNNQLREVKVRACYLLGSFRDVEATDELAKNIDLEAGGGDVARWGRYPCGEALYTIGKHAEPALLFLLAETESETKRELALQILMTRRGKCGAEELIRERLNGISEQHHLRLQKALRELDAPTFEKRADFPGGAYGPGIATGKGNADVGSSAQGLDKSVYLLQNARSVQDLDDAVGWAEHRRHEVAGKWIDLLRRTSSAEVKTRACFLLGSFGATEAIPVLIQNIRVTPAIREFSMIPAWGSWPCETALYDLGTSAEKPLLDLLAETDIATTRDSAVQVLIGLRGRCGAAELVRKALVGQGGSRAKWLKEAVDRIENPYAYPVPH